ncbi:NfeD family protein, partial [candidate division KSB1 bacterium]|nr:NfeD family protein [candidate division KSB1 bacterium]
FSFGCFAAAVAAALDFGVTVQLLVFSSATFVVFISVRPILMKFLINRNNPAARTNIERLVGMIGIAQEEVTGWQGSVKVEGEIWSSRSEGDLVLSTGSHVRVLRVEGNKLIVGPNGGSPYL